MQHTYIQEKLLCELIKILEKSIIIKILELFRNYYIMMMLDFSKRRESEETKK